MPGKSIAIIATPMIAILVVSAFGYWALPKTLPVEISTVTQTSSTVISPQTQSSSTAVTSTAGNTRWVNITSTHPVGYYLSLLASNGTEPYVQLADQLRVLPELQIARFANKTAVAQITYLALNATNPEAKEAFQLMLKGGIADFTNSNSAPSVVNTELEVLYWLANSIQFKRDDPLVLAVAMTEGIWVALGDWNVAGAVKEDALSYLLFLRGTDELQKQRGYFDLERYPLKAKIALAWRGDQSSVWSHNDPAIS